MYTKPVVVTFLCLIVRGKLFTHTRTIDRPFITRRNDLEFDFFFIQGPEPVFAPSIFFQRNFQNGRACALSGSHAHAVSSINVHFFYTAINRIFFPRGFHVCIMGRITLLQCEHWSTLYVVTLLYYCPRVS